MLDIPAITTITGRFPGRKPRYARNGGHNSNHAQKLAPIHSST